MELRGVIWRGIVGVSTADVIRKQLKQAEKDQRVKAVILKLNRPAAVLASDEINKAVAGFNVGAKTSAASWQLGDIWRLCGDWPANDCRE